MFHTDFSLLGCEPQPRHHRAEFDLRRLFSFQVREISIVLVADQLQQFRVHH